MSLTELATAAGVTPRTVRYYIAQGLLPGPVGQGPGAQYTDGHLGRLRLIRRLQEEHLPLAEIRIRLRDLDDATVIDLARATGPKATDEAEAAGPNDDALAYIERILGAGQGRDIRPKPLLRRTQLQPPARAAAMRFERHVPDEFPLPDERHAIRETSAPFGDPPYLPSRGLPAPDRSTWERISLTPDVEVHVRRPLDRPTNRRLDQLLELARRLFGPP